MTSLTATIRNAWRSARVQEKLFLSHASFALGAALVTVAVSLPIARMALIDRALRQLEAVRSLKAVRVEGYLSDMAQALGAAEVSPSVRQLVQTVEGMPYPKDVFSAAFLGHDGRILHALDKDAFQDFPSDWPQGQHPAIREARCLVSGKARPCLYFARRLAKGVLALKVLPHEIVDILRAQMGLGKTGENYLVGADGFFKTPSLFWDQDKVLGTPIDTVPWKKAFKEGKGALQTRDYRGVEVLSAYILLPVAAGPDLRWALLSEVDLEEVLAPLGPMAKVLFACLLALLVLAVFLARLASRRVGGPVDSLLSELRLRQLGLYEGQELERKRLAKDLHDGIGQQLTAMSLSLGGPGMSELERQALKEAMDRTMTEVRRIAMNLMPAVLQNFGLSAAIKRLCEGAASASGIDFEFRAHGLGPEHRLPQATELHVYRICQEATTNVIRHSGAKHCSVDLSVEVGKGVYLEISDDGRGPSPGPTEGSGLTGMRERVEALKGEFGFSATGLGARLTARIPWEEQK